MIITAWRIILHDLVTIHGVFKTFSTKHGPWVCPSNSMPSFIFSSREFRDKCSAYLRYLSSPRPSTKESIIRQQSHRYDETSPSLPFQYSTRPAPAWSKYRLSIEVPYRIWIRLDGLFRLSLLLVLSRKESSLQDADMLQVWKNRTLMWMSAITMSVEMSTRSTRLLHGDKGVQRQTRVKYEWLVFWTEFVLQGTTLPRRALGRRVWMWVSQEKLMIISFHFKNNWTWTLLQSFVSNATRLFLHCVCFRCFAAILLLCFL